MTPNTIPEVRHATAAVNGTTLHYVSAGATGTPLLLVHGFPESWWAFHRAIPLLARHPQDVRSLIATEMGLAGFGLEALADVTHGGSWHIGVLAAPGIAELLLTGRERRVLGEWAFPSMTGRPGSITEDDVAEFART